VAPERSQWRNRS